MKSVYKKVNRSVLNRKNPFLEDTFHHIEKGEKTLLFGNREPDLLIDNDGNVKGHSLFARKMTIDKAKFMKVFMTGLSNWFDLSKASIKVFAYIANEVQPNRDSFDFDMTKCKEFTGYKGASTILSAIGELIENQFIARGPNPYRYFINPTIFFNGDRLTFIEQYELEKKEQAQTDLKEHQKQTDLINGD